MRINNPMLSRSLQEFGAKGGNNRTTNQTPKQRSKHAANAANSRWKGTKHEIPKRTNG